MSRHSFLSSSMTSTRVLAAAGVAEFLGGIDMVVLLAGSLAGQVGEIPHFYTSLTIMAVREAEP